MSDINWRDINEDRSVFLPENKRKEILVETDVTTRLDWAEHINPHNNLLKTCKETVKRYAFLD